MSFGKRLLALIQEKNKKEKFSQAELSRQLGVARVTVSQWVTGKTTPII
jgi:transcriptional regulator with XRE-family HTH domain